MLGQIQRRGAPAREFDKRASVAAEPRTPAAPAEVRDRWRRLLRAAGS